MTNDEKATKYDALVQFADDYQNNYKLSSYALYQGFVDGINQIIGDPGDIPHAPDKGPFNVCQDPGIPVQPETVDP